MDAAKTGNCGEVRSRDIWPRSNSDANSQIGSCQHHIRRNRRSAGYDEEACRVRGQFCLSRINVDIQLSLFTPAQATRPLPVIMELGLSPEAWAAVLKRIPEDQRAGFSGKGPTWQQQVVAKGWGYAILIPATLQPDNGAD